MTSGAIAAMLSTILYGRRFFPYYVYNIIGGLDEEGMYLKLISVQDNDLIKSERVFSRWIFCMLLHYINLICRDCS